MTGTGACRGRIDPKLLEDEFRRRLEAAERLLRSLPTVQNAALETAVSEPAAQNGGGDYQQALERFTSALEDFSKLILDGIVPQPGDSAVRPPQDPAPGDLR